MKRTNRNYAFTTAFVDALAAVGLSWAEVCDLVHGTTMATNAIVQGRLVPVALVATEGFGDTIEIGRQNRRELYRLEVPPKLPSLVPAEHRIEAQERIDSKGLHHCELAEMDATQLKFADNSFDVVYAPYVISVVPDPVAVAREMYRVCRPGGRVIILNHFKSANPLMGRIERAISPMTVHIGFTADLDLPAFLAQADLHPVSMEKVNVPRMWTLVTVVKD